MLGGGGLGDLFDNFSLDSSSVITIVVIGVAAIFVLPQIIYWLTGVNLSAFNWGRSNYIPIVSIEIAKRFLIFNFSLQNYFANQSTAFKANIYNTC